MQGLRVAYVLMLLFPGPMEMLVHNSKVAAILNQTADLLEIEGANVFRVRAYRNAARTAANWPESLASRLKNDGELPRMAGIGEDLRGKITRILKTGSFELLDELKQKAPPHLTELLEIPSLGPKRVRILRDQLRVTSPAELEKAAREHRIKELRGFSDKLEQKILTESRRFAKAPHRLKLAIARQIAEPLLEYLKQIAGVTRAIAAGSYRRGTETVGDLDILVACRNPKLVMERFISYDEVVEILAHGPSRSTTRFESGLQVDVRAVPPESYGAALHYFTGSKTHNIAIRSLGVRRGLKINEYGIFKNSRRIGGSEESEVFEKVGLPYIEPELRENRGEIEAARRHELPRLVTLDDIRGDLHVHSDETDGRLTLEELAEAAEHRGYEYLAITDHSRHLTVARGMTPQRALAQARRIDKLNNKLKKLRLLKSIELDILEDGRLDLPDSALAALDFTVCSIHYKFNLTLQQQTERVLRAMDNKYFNILGHPTGRLIGERDPYEIDIDRILKAAKERGCFVELNCQPDRLDLDDVHLMEAKKLGLRVAISTDAHGEAELDFIRGGLSQARRGWLSSDDVLNTRPMEQLLKLLKRR
jgi:DNA polymerase (family 10)